MHLKDGLKTIAVEDSKPIPWIVRLLENPRSRFSLPGRISLYNHDCLHIILGQDLSSSGEASVVGFCMGNDPDTNNFHLIIFKIFSRYLYPKKFRLLSKDWVDFKAAFVYGRSRKMQGISLIDFRTVEKTIPISKIRKHLGVCPQDLNLLKSEFHLKNQKKKQATTKVFRWSSSWIGVLGAIILALNISISVFGYVFLALSSFLLGVSYFTEPENKSTDRTTLILFVVNLFGIYRWH